MNLRNLSSLVSSYKAWNVVFEAIVWNIWMNHNSVAFKVPSDDCWSILERNRSLAWSTHQGLAPVNGGVGSTWRRDALDWGWYLLVVHHIDSLVKCHWVVQFRRIHRNYNKVVDALAKLDDSSHLNCLCLSFLPSTVAGLVQADDGPLTIP
ncbi:hypothetical protein V6N12_074897 [Hibiscus sabdariffa]|uniref:RNase H type-1 domain-containing protein n=1 Tax=Hibiscus sabdariffa TaxID=183260 RepID=A0ABR2D2R7_9ROSI